MLSLLPGGHLFARVLPGALLVVSLGTYPISLLGGHSNSAMGCGASLSSAADSAPVPAPIGKGTASVAPKKSGTLPADDGEQIAELLTLGACQGSVFDNYLFGRTLGAQRDRERSQTPFPCLELAMF